MALSPTTVKYIAIGVVIVVAAIIALSIVWDLLKIAVGLLIGIGLIWLGIRFMLGKGLPPKMKKLADKALNMAKEDKE
jgi:hypothetical protein